MRLVTARALASNRASNRVLEKAGLTRVGTCAADTHERLGGHEPEVAVCAFTREDWERTQR
jgi:RimJ/RimL family protein N-acetyltransferase